LGHLLGLEHSDTGVMEATLAPGARLLPQALASAGSGTLAAAPANSGPATAPSASAPPSATLSGTSRPEASAAAPAPPAVTLPAVATVAGTGSQRARAALVNAGPQAAFRAATAPPAVPLVPPRDSSAVPVPGLRPPSPRGESGADEALSQEAQQGGWPVSPLG